MVNNHITINHVQLLFKNTENLWLVFFITNNVSRKLSEMKVFWTVSWMLKNFQFFKLEGSQIHSFGPAIEKADSPKLIKAAFSQYICCVCLVGERPWDIKKTEIHHDSGQKSWLVVDYALHPYTCTFHYNIILSNT